MSSLFMTRQSLAWPPRLFWGWTGLLCLAFCAIALTQAWSAERAGRPNLVIIFCDDLGYGDLGCFGHPVIRTPNLDRMAAEGQRWTSFYVAASICTPSRAGLLTGRYPIRSGLASGVLFPNSKGGLPHSEVTLAELLKQAGYATGIVGKWHLGHLPQFLPTRHGFDTYWGIPYSNDMDKRSGPDYQKVIAADANAVADPNDYNVPIMQDEQIIERPANQFTLTQRYTEHAVQFIQAHRDEPFFLYLAHSMPHIPLFASQAFRGRSPRGLYGDVLEEIDWSVGRVLDTLRKLRIAEQTLVVFTSDNGPWLPFNTHGGSAGPLRGGKFSAFEGGFREPTIFWWPGHLKQGVVREMGSTLDLLPTMCALARIEPPRDRVLDGYDLSPVLFGTGPSPRDHMIFYRGAEVWAVRQWPYKAHYKTREPAYGPAKTKVHNPPLLYHLEHDPSEKYNIASKHPDVLKALTALVEAHKRTVKPIEDQITKR